MLLRGYQFPYDAGVLNETKRGCIIILIPKCNKDQLPQSSYRPIILLNFDYKIIATVINSRMKCYLYDLIRPDQSAFIKGRHIGDNIRLLFDVIDTTAKFQDPFSLQIF